MTEISLKDHETELLGLVDQYQKALVKYESAKNILDTVKLALRAHGTTRVGDFYIDVSTIERESISWGDIKKTSPHLAAQLIDLGLVKKSTSDRLTVKLKEPTK